MEDPELQNDQIIDEDHSGDERDGDGDDAAAAKAEYVKKEFVARPYASPWETDKQVKNLIVRNQR